MQRLKLVFVLGLAVCLVTTVSLVARQEHPKEHPGKEHPAAKPVSTATLEKAIHDQVAEKSKAGGGKFPVNDDVLKKTWQLALVRVHTDKLTQLDAHTYFACVDFKADDGTAVDVDFYLRDDKGKLALADTTVHKVNGKPRFTYQQKGNFWERVKAAG